ncbi:MAG: glycoside hydrolase family 127 protein [Promethearchaeota archaeon]
MNGALQKRPYIKLYSIPFYKVEITDEFWSRRQEINATVSVYKIHEELEKHHHVDNFRVAAGVKKGIHMGDFYYDSDLYKWLEGACYFLKLKKNENLERIVKEIVELIQKAQLKDGYINTFFSTKFIEKRFTNFLLFHELYCAGHLFEAAVAHYETFRTPKLLKVAERFANLLVKLFLKNKVVDTAGHPEIELALMRLNEITGVKNYVKLVKYLIELRGNLPNYKTYVLRNLINFIITLNAAEKIKQEYMKKVGILELPKEEVLEFISGLNISDGVQFLLENLNGKYYQLDKPIKEVWEPVGHCVRALYLYCGVVDLYSTIGDESLLTAMERTWLKMVKARMYVTGGIGNARGTEGFSSDFNLKNEDSYSETCAAIANFFWNWRLLNVTEKCKYADLMERLMYNAILVGQSLDGKKYFYSNSMLSKGKDERKEWFKCACCPTNFIRFIPTIGQYIYGFNAKGIWIHQYISSKTSIILPSGQKISITQKSGFPWEGTVELQFDSNTNGKYSIFLRIPEWARSTKLSLNDKPYQGNIQVGRYLQILKSWDKEDRINLNFIMEPTLNGSDSRIKSNINKVVISRGPLIYCMEQLDNKEFDIFKCKISRYPNLDVKKNPNLLQGINIIQGEISEGKTFTTIPYYACFNRGPTGMQVWLPIETNERD